MKRETVNTDSSNLRYCYEYPRPAVSADCAVFCKASGVLKILLIQRGNEPFKGKWALPGGFMNMDENVEQCARRELLEETGIEIDGIEQLYTFSDVNRDPRGRVVTVVYFAMIDSNVHTTIRAGDDASKAQWFAVEDMPRLAFDHELVVDMAVRRVIGD